MTKETLAPTIDPSEFGSKSKRFRQSEEEKIPFTKEEVTEMEQMHEVFQDINKKYKDDKLSVTERAYEAVITLTIRNPVTQGSLGTLYMIFFIAFAVAEIMQESLNEGNNPFFQYADEIKKWYPQEWKASSLLVEKGPQMIENTRKAACEILLGDKYHTSNVVKTKVAPLVAKEKEVNVSEMLKEKEKEFDSRFGAQMSNVERQEQASHQPGASPEHPVGTKAMTSDSQTL